MAKRSLPWVNLYGLGMPGQGRGLLGLLEACLEGERRAASCWCALSWRKPFLASSSALHWLDGRKDLHGFVPSRHRDRLVMCRGSLGQQGNLIFINANHKSAIY
jgi:hypothetical protein